MSYVFSCFTNISKSEDNLTSTLKA